MSLYLKAAEQLRSNKDQWAAYEDQGHCVVLAGPGSGKTKLLTVKMARIAAEDVRAPHAVACVTYSTECVRELRGRLSKLGVEESRGLFLGTLHAFCLQHVLRPYARLAGIPMPEPLNVAGLKQQSAVFDEALKTLNMGSSSGLKLAVDKFRRDNLDVELWDQNESVAKLALAYEQRLASSGLIDFELMTRTAVRAVEQHLWVRKCLRARFPVLVVDEYQDLGTALRIPLAPDR